MPPFVRMNKLWQSLPTDMLNLILEYNGTITYRHGKYMNKIPTFDFRYIMLRRSYLFHRKSYNPGRYCYSDVSFFIPNSRKWVQYSTDASGMIIIMVVSPNNRDNSKVEIITLFTNKI